MFTCMGIPKHWRLLLFRYETFIKFFGLLVFRHEEIETQFLQCWWFLHRLSVNSLVELSVQSQNLNSLTQQTHAYPIDHNWTSLAQVRISTHCFFFKKSPKFPAQRFWTWRHSYPGYISYLEFLLWYLWLSHPPRVSVNTCINSRTVLSLTKLNDKI